jgi:hypothetical protein
MSVLPFFVEIQIELLDEAGLRWHYAIQLG